MQNIAMDVHSQILKQYYTTCHGCETLRHPICFVDVNLPSDTVDVNVDPNKTQVLLQHLVEVRTCLEEILLEVYGPLENVPSWHYAEAGDGGRKGHISGEKTESNAQPKVLDQGEFHFSKQRKEKEVGENDGSSTGSVLVDRGGQSHKDSNSNGFSSIDSCSTLTVIQHANNSKESETTPTTSSESKDESSISTLNNNVVKNLTEAPSKDCDDINISNTKNTDTFMDMTDEDLLEIFPEGSWKVTGDGSSNASVDQSGSSGSVARDSAVRDVDKDVDQGTAAGSSWSKGTSLMDRQGNTLQPVQLLPPGPLQKPGKRPPSPTTISSSVAKSPKLNSSGLNNSSSKGDKSTNSPVARPESPFTHFCKEKRLELSQKHPGDDADEITSKLKHQWSALDDDDKVKYRDQHWQQKRRFDKQASSNKGDSSSKKGQPDVRKAVADLASQSQNERQKRVLKRRLYSKEVRMKLTMNKLRSFLEQDRPNTENAEHSKLEVIGHLGLSELWAFVHASQVVILKATRLREQILYENLIDRHKLSSAGCAEPILLNRHIEESLWPVLEEIATQSQTSDAYFSIKDERIVSNGFDVKCHRDSEGRLQAELVGLCDFIPTYEVKDLNEVLRLISSSSQVSLGKARPLKVQYYLQGEAVRMAHNTGSTVSASVVLDQLTSLDNLSESVRTFSNKPILHHLVDLADLLI